MSEFALNLLYNFFINYIFINIGLAVFNLLPIPPLDGSRMVGAFLSDGALYKYYQYQNVINIVMFALLLLGFFNRPLEYVQNVVFKWVILLSRFPFLPILNSFTGI